MGWAMAIQAESVFTPLVLDASEKTMTEQPNLGEHLLTAESPALRERLLHPERLFLWEGAESVGPGTLFYATTEETRRLWMAGWLDAATEWTVLEDAWAGDDSLSLAFQSHGGAEVGDGLYREMQGQSRNEENRTPAYLVEGKVAATTRLRIRTKVHQNDVATYRTFGQRSDRLRSSQGWGDMAYQGENLPTRSLALVAMDYDPNWGRIGAALAHGWHWSLSPITGTYHPWVVTLSKLQWAWNENFGAYWNQAHWETPDAVRMQEGKGLQTEVGMAMRDRGDGWGWRIGLGVERRIWRVSDDSNATLGFSGRDGIHFPFSLEAKRRADFDGYPGLEWKTEWQTTSRDGLVVLQGNSSLARMSGRHRPEFSIAGYGVHRITDGTGTSEWRRLPDTSTVADAKESVPGKNSWEIVGGFRPKRFAGGAAGSLSYAFVPGSESMSFRGQVATDWGRPKWEGQVTENQVGDVQAAMNPTQEQTAREGRYVGSQHALHNAQVQWTVATTRIPRTTWSTTTGARIFLGREATQLEYEPAPFWASSEWNTTLPTDLFTTALIQFVGPKIVRGFSSTPWRIAPHWECQLGMRQTFLQNRMGAQVQFLHAFGKEVLEHPMGNPLRFRVRIGMDGRW
jgi:hypothetical protein